MCINHIYIYSHIVGKVSDMDSSKYPDAGRREIATGGLLDLSYQTTTKKRRQNGYGMLKPGLGRLFSNWNMAYPLVISQPSNITIVSR